MDSRRSLTRTAFHVVLLLTLLLTPAGADPAPGRVVAVADVHGVYGEFTALLREVGLVDNRDTWSGGNATFVQTGDVMDRGPQTRQCLDLLMDLERQAPATGGRVIPLLGNHEVMNILGDLRYVTKEIFSTFAEADAEKRREQAHKEYLTFLAGHRGHGHEVVPPTDGGARRTWMDEHPPGFFEHRDAFGAEGKYGRWLRAHHAVVQIGDGVFVHGGLSPSLEFGSIRELDERVIADLAAFDAMWRTLVESRVIWRYMTFSEAVRFSAEELAWQQAEGPIGVFAARSAIIRLLGYKSWITIAADGPLWYRGLATDQEEKLADGLKAMLRRLGAAYIVAGHSVVVSKTVATRFESRVFLIDTGMNGAAYAGNASALGIQDGRFVAYQVGGTPRSLAPPPDLRVATPGAGQVVK